jgi:hypothetical protein
MGIHTGRNFSGVSRLEAAERLEKIAASLRSGLIDADDGHTRIPDRVGLEVTVDEGELGVTVAWGARARTQTLPETPSAKDLLDQTGDAAVARVEAHEAAQIRVADEAVVRDAREGRMP